MTKKSKAAADPLENLIGDEAAADYRAMNAAGVTSETIDAYFAQLGEDDEATTEGLRRFARRRKCK